MGSTFTWSDAASLIGGCMLTVLLVLLISEVIFRKIFARSFRYDPYEDEYDEESQILKSKPGTEGRYNLRDSHYGYFRINNEGWNSPREYHRKRRPGITRIACIGSSDTEALQVDVRRSHPQVVEKELAARGAEVEVYTFSKSHVHLAQALHLARYVAREFQPDILVIGTFGGGFMASTTDYRYYLSIDVEEGGIREIPPTSPLDGSSIMKPDRLADLVHSFQLIRYLSSRYAIKLRAMNLLRKILARMSGRRYVPHANRPDKHSQALATSPAYQKNLERAVEYLLDQFKLLETRHGIRIVFHIGPWHMASHSRLESMGSEAEEQSRQYLNTLLQRANLRYLDLTDSFAEDYGSNGIRFDFPYDGHLNEHGHRVKGATIAEFLIGEASLLPPERSQPRS